MAPLRSPPLSSISAPPVTAACAPLAAAAAAHSIPHPQPSSASPLASKPSCNLGDRLAHAWDYIRFSLRLDEADGLDFQSHVWSSLRSRVSPTGNAGSSASLLFAHFRPSSLLLDAPLVATILQFRFGGVAAEFAVLRVSERCFSFLVACDKVAGFVIACSPIASDHYFASINALPPIDGGQPSSCLHPPTSAPGSAASRLSSYATGPGAASSLLPPRTTGDAGRNSSAAIVGCTSSSSTSQRRHRQSTQVRPFRPGIAFRKFIMRDYRGQVSKPLPPPSMPNAATLWVVFVSDTVIPSPTLLNGALDHRFASQTIFSCLQIETCLFRTQAFSVSVRNEIVCRSPVPFSNFKLLLFACPLRARDAAVSAAVGCDRTLAARAAQLPPSILGNYQTCNLPSALNTATTTTDGHAHTHQNDLHCQTFDPLRANPAATCITPVPTPIGPTIPPDARPPAALSPPLTPGGVSHDYGSHARALTCPLLNAPA